MSNYKITNNITRILENWVKFVSMRRKRRHSRFVYSIIAFLPTLKSYIDREFTVYDIKTDLRPTKLWRILQMLTHIRVLSKSRSYKNSYRVLLTEKELADLPFILRYHIDP